MILHKLLIGDGAGTYLPFGLSRLRALHALHGDGYFQQKYRVPGFDVYVKQEPPFQYVTVRASGMYFEFATSGFPIVQTTMTQEGHDLLTYKGCIVGVTVGDDMTLSPVIRGLKRTSSGSDLSLIGRPFQVQLVNEPVGYPLRFAAKYPLALYESWAPGNPHTGIPIRNTEFLAGLEGWFNAGPTTQYVARDQFFDTPFSDGIKRKKVVTAYLRGDADWPRASGIQVVTDATLGSREFAIYVDARGQFSAFPTASIGAVDGVNQNVPADVVKMVAPTLPAWCYAPTARVRDYVGTVTEGLVDFPEFDWKFNHLGTRAATIAYERSPYENDTAYWSSSADPDHPFTPANFAEIQKRMGVLDRDDQFSVLPDHNTNRYFVAPGIVEATVKIALTGPDPGDFTLDVTVAEKRRPTTMDAWSLVVGYVWHDCQKTAKTELEAATFYAKAGDLVSIDVELWSPKTGEIGAWTALSFSGNGNSAQLLSVQRLSPAPTEIACTLARPLLAVDLTTLSWVTQAFSLADGADPNYLGALVTVKGKVKEVLLPKTGGRPQDKASMLEWAAKDGRAFIQAIVASDPRWQRIKIVPEEGDGWANAALLAYREFFARHALPFVFKRFADLLTPTPFFEHSPGGSFDFAWSGYDTYKTGAAPTVDATLTSAREDVYGRWQTYPGTLTSGVALCFFCREPKWGWNTYASWAASFMWLSPYVTFFTHPNGTWAYWDDSNVFVPQSILASFSTFDASKVEHVIFDRVHFERTLGGKRDTSFRELYNKAVRKGGDGLEHGISEISEANLRASFGAFPALDVQPNAIGEGPGFHTITFLDLFAVWDAGHWFMPDPAVANGVTLAHQPRTRIGSMRGLRFDHAWYSGVQYTGDRQYPVSATPHVRFANPVLVGA